MSGSKAGGKKTAATIKKKHGEDFYAEIGRKGGKKSAIKGFASNKVGKDGLTGRERASKAGAIGGARSKRGPAIKTLNENDLKPRAKKATSKKKEETKKRWWHFIAKGN